MAAPTPAERLRIFISERVPEGGDATDTMFSDDEVQDFLNQGGGDPQAGAYYGWLAKAAEYTNLADVTEGNSVRNFSDMAANALKMAELYAAKAGVGESPARVRIGKVTRTGGSI